MDIRSTLRDVKDVLGIAQGAQFVWALFGLGSIVGAVVGGLLAVAGRLPWWSVVGIALGAAVLSGGLLYWLIAWMAARRRPRPDAAYVALTGVIESGMRLAARIRDEAIAPETTAEDKAPWDVRLEDWAAEAEKTLAEVAPDRLPAFKADVLIADMGKMGVPRWISGELTDLELQIERLRNIRASI